MSAPVSPSRRDAAAPQRSHAPTPTSAETERDAYRRQLETLAENATLALFIMDEQQRCTYMNPAAERLTGFTLGELQGRALHYYVHHTRPDGSDYPLEECPIDRAFPRNMREQGTEVFVHKDGHFYPVAFTASPIREGGRTVGTIIEVRDIGDERVRAEEMARLLGAERAARGERERLVAALEVERSRLATVFAETPSMLAIVRGPEYVLELANAAYLALTGHRDVLGKPLLEAVPELRGQGFERLLDAVVATGEPYVGREVPTWLSPAPGAPLEERFFDFVYLPLVEPDATGAPARVGVIAHGSDITEQVRARREVERARERADRLQALTAALAATTAPAEVAEVVVAQGVAAAGAATGMLVVRAANDPGDGDGAPELVTLRQTGLPAELAAAYARFPLRAAVPAATSVRTGQAFFLEEGGAVRAAFPEVPHVFDALGTQALATVPLAVGGEAVGAMSFTFTAARAFPAEDREFFLALGRQAAQALERARLLAAERTARERTEALQRVTAALARAQTMADVGRVFSREVTTLLGADTAWVGVVTPDGTAVEALGWSGYAEGEADRWRRLPLDAGIALTDAVRSARPTWWPTREALAAAYPARAALIRTLAQDGVAVVPILGEGVPDAGAGTDDGRAHGAVGGIVVGFRSPQRFDADTRAFLLALAQQCGQAIARARAYDAEQAARLEAEAARTAAEAANRAKSEFLAVMSHELRTPLNAIGGYAELMEMGIRGPVTPQQAEDLRRIQASQRHLLGLVNEVLNYARIETGTVHYDVTDVALAEVVAAVEPLVAPQLAAKGLAFSHDGCAETPLVARADREKVRQVLLNLLSNAVKFTAPGGRVVVACDAEGDRVAVRVTDTGIGIPPAELGRVFEPFVQVNASLTRPHEGTGLGLAISRDLARAMGGDVTVTSTPGVGSAFTLTLPRA